MVLRISSGGRDVLLTMLVMVLRISSGVNVLLTMLVMVLRISSGVNVLLTMLVMVLRIFSGVDVLGWGGELSTMLVRGGGGKRGGRGKIELLTMLVTPWYSEVLLE